MKIIAVYEKTASIIESLTNVWEQSVRASHLFLSSSDIEEIKKYVPQALEKISHLIIAENEDGVTVGFMGVSNGKLEMLFISPEERGKGLGRILIQYGVELLSLTEVTVNEQNPQAIGFYTHMGFEIYKRTDLDEQGRPFPLLYMKLG